jgi:hypothetical protein
MGCRRISMVLLCMVVVAALVGLGTDASAGCTKPPCASVKWYSGSCICCTTGSEIFNFTALGVPGWFTKNCPLITDLTGQLIKDANGNPEQANCVKCAVFGTQQIDGGGTCGDQVLDPDCGVAGTAFCVNNGGNASNAQGQPFTMTNTVGLFGAGDFSNCTKAGKCSGTIQVIGDLSQIQCQNAQWDPIGFTASEFRGQCSTCDNGFDSTGQCCADATRVPDGSGGFTCGNPTPGTSTDSGPFQCSIANVPKPGNAKPYQCCNLDPITGVCMP